MIPTNELTILGRILAAGSTVFLVGASVAIISYYWRYSRELKYVIALRAAHLLLLLFMVYILFAAPHSPHNGIRMIVVLISNMLSLYGLYKINVYKPKIEGDLL